MNFLFGIVVIVVIVTIAQYSEIGWYLGFVVILLMALRYYQIRTVGVVPQTIV